MANTRNSNSPTSSEEKLSNGSILEIAVIDNYLDINNEKNEQSVELPNDMLLVISLYMSVFDVPTLVLVCQFFAAQADTLWRHHAWRIYQLHPPSVLPDAHLKKPLTSWHDRFFMKYNDHTYFGLNRNHNRNYFRRGLQISEGKVKDFISEYYNGIPVKKSGKDEVIKDNTISIHALFGENSPLSNEIRELPAVVRLSLFGFKPPQQRPALLALAQQLPKDELKLVLDFFYEEVVLPYCGKKLKPFAFHMGRIVDTTDVNSIPELRMIALDILNVELLRHVLEFKTLNCNQLILLCDLLIKRKPMSILFFLIDHREMELALHILKFDAKVDKILLFRHIFSSAYATYRISFDTHVRLEMAPVNINARKEEKDIWFYCRDNFPEDYSKAIQIISNLDNLAFLRELESPIQDEINSFENKCKHKLGGL